jgi:aspartyl/asparaginyl-tRNA synthetase
VDRFRNYRHQRRAAADIQGEVEFIAILRVQSRLFTGVHAFLKEGRWFYVDGDILSMLKSPLSFLFKMAKPKSRHFLIVILFVDDIVMTAFVFIISLHLFM